MSSQWSLECGIFRDGQKDRYGESSTKTCRTLHYERPKKRGGRSSVCVGTGLRTGKSGIRILRRGKTVFFSAKLLTVHGAQTLFYTMRDKCSFPGVKRSGRKPENLAPSSAEPCSAKHLTLRGAQTLFYTMRDKCSFPGVKRSGREPENLAPSCTEPVQPPSTYSSGWWHEN
jgi:rRNA maturation protein Nop10